MGRFQDKRVIVTGAGSGFGEATAKRFAEEGGRVVVSDLNEEGMQRVAEEIRSAGGGCVTAACNVAEESAVEAMVQTAVDAYGGIDVLVNNAGYSHHQKLICFRILFYMVC